MTKIKGNKKASASDLIFIAVAITFFAIITLISFKIGNEFNTEVQTNSDFPVESRTSSTKLIGYFPGTLDNLALFLLIGLSIASLALASLVRIHPVFIGFFFIAFLFIIFISGILSNTYQEMAANPLLINEANQLATIGFVIGKLPFIIGVLGIGLMVIMYKTWSNN